MRFYVVSNSPLWISDVADRKLILLIRFHSVPVVKSGIKSFPLSLPLLLLMLPMNTAPTTTTIANNTTNATNITRTTTNTTTIIIISAITTNSFTFGIIHVTAILISAAFVITVVGIITILSFANCVEATAMPWLTLTVVLIIIIRVILIVPSIVVSKTQWIHNMVFLEFCLTITVTDVLKWLLDTIVVSWMNFYFPVPGLNRFCSMVVLETSFS